MNRNDIDVECRDLDPASNNIIIIYFKKNLTLGRYVPEESLKIEIYEIGY